MSKKPALDVQIDPNDPLAAVRMEIAKGNLEVHRNLRAWPQISSDVSTQDVYATDDLIGNSNNLLARVAKEYERVTFFPPSTSYLHSLGVVGAAMLKNFTFKTPIMSGTASIMVVTGQPPSSGKSGINKIYTAPYEMEVEDLNIKSMKAKTKLKKQLKMAKEELDEAQNDNQIDMLVDRIASLIQKIKEVPTYGQIITNPTSEGLEKEAKEHDRSYVFISDEDGGLNTLLGLAYGGGNQHSNIDSVLQAWNDDYMGVARSGRDGYKGRIKGAIAVLAQGRAIQTMIEASTRGVGFTERFLMWYERDRLGTREFTTESKVWSHDVKLLVPALIHNIMQAKPTELKVSQDCLDYMVKVKNHYEKMVVPGGVCSAPMLRQFAMKVEMHVYKIASVLHVVKEWMPSGYDPERGITNLLPSGNLTIQLETVREAAILFEKILKYYAKASDANLAGGRRSEQEIIREKLKARAEKGQRRITKKVLLDDIKRISAFKGQASLGKHLAEHVFPDLEKEGIMLSHGSEIFINPNFA